MKFRPGVFALFLIILLLPACGTTFHQRQSRPFKRGVWVTRWDFKTAADVEQIVANVAAMGFDHLHFQVRGNGDALYNSSLEPWSNLLGGKDPGFDPLARAVKAGRRHGIQIHAWVNVVAGWRGLQPPDNPRQLYNARPEWFLVGKKGKRQPLKKNYYVALNPCLPEVRTYLAKVCADISRRYDIAGLHLDYIRFLAIKKGEDYPRDPKSLQLFTRETGIKHPDQNPARWNSWRKNCIDQLVKEISATAKKARPQLIVSTAVTRNNSRRKRFFQDPEKWAREGWVDRIYPMLYEKNNAGRFMGYVNELVPLQKYGVKIIPGIGTWLHADHPQTSARFINIAHHLGSSGICIFAYAALFPPREKTGDQAAGKNLRQTLTPLIKKDW